MQIIPQKQFDRELDINDLLKGVDQNKLQNVLQVMLDEQVCILDTAGNIVLGVCSEGTDPVRIPLSIQLEPVAYLEASDTAAALNVAMLVELLLKSSERYLMASELHLEAVHADYEKLQKEHEALLASEEKYRALAQNLEQRVQEQVTTIDNAHRQLYQAEKLASVGQLAAGVAHEINNPIGFIRSNLATAQKYVGDIIKFCEQVKNADGVTALHTAWDDSDLEFTLQDFTELIDESSSGADRVTKIVADLKDFSNVDGNDVELTDLNQVIRSVSNVAASRIAQKAELELALHDLPMTRCRSGHLGQVFLNILLNASAAINQDDGKIWIESALLGNEIVVRISDSGCGISEEVLGRIFDPFYTTQDVGSGTGLGLTVSRDIVQAHGGRIEVDSRVGEGTIFSVYLPVGE